MSILDGDTFSYCEACGEPTSGNSPCKCPPPETTLCRKCGVTYRKGTEHSEQACRDFIQWRERQAALVRNVRRAG